MGLTVILLSPQNAEESFEAKETYSLDLQKGWNLIEYYRNLLRI